MATVTGSVVRATDRVSDVLARDETLVEVFVRCSPHFAKLRNRVMRRTMARLVTVEQAARIAAVPVTTLLHNLNAALGLAAGMPMPERDAVAVTAASDAGGGLTYPPDAPVIEVDVREALRAGHEPFSRIMAAVSTLAPHEVLHVRAIFEPVPLFTVLGKRGFAHESRAHGPDDWSVWFWRWDGEPVETDSADEGATIPNEADTVVLDVRGLEPPEPMVRTLTALDALPEGHTLLHVNVRVPRFLLPVLEERGYDYEIDESRPDRVFMRIWSSPPSLDDSVAGNRQHAGS
jgi:uncharacterized protein (DUF2249 family)